MSHIRLEVTSLSSPLRTRLTQCSNRQENYGQIARLSISKHVIYLDNFASPVAPCFVSLNAIGNHLVVLLCIF